MPERNETTAVNATKRKALRRHYLKVGSPPNGMERSETKRKERNGDATEAISTLEPPVAVGERRASKFPKRSTLISPCTAGSVGGSYWRWEYRNRWE